MLWLPSSRRLYPHSSLTWQFPVSVIGSKVGDAYRKLRNTARYLIGNLHDFDPAVNAVPYDELPRLDKYMLGRLASLLQEVEDAYETYQFSRASQALQVQDSTSPRPVSP